MTISSAVQLSAVARAVGVKTGFKNLRSAAPLLLPQIIAVIGQGATAATYETDPVQLTSSFAVGAAFGFGSPLHLASRQLFPANGDGVGAIPVVFFPLEDAGSGVAAAGDITPSGAATGAGSFKVVVNNIESEEFSVANADTVGEICDAIVAAVNAVVEMPVIAADGDTEVTLTAKWAGLSGNAIAVEVVATTTNNTGVSLAVTQLSGGLVDPDLQGALDLFGETWYTAALNCLDTTNTTALATLNSVGEGRWGALTRRPFVAFTGTNDNLATASAITEARKTERVNCLLSAPGSADLPLVIAARQLARIAYVANDDPARDYAGQSATGLVPGADSAQWSYADRDAAVKAGLSTSIVRDGVVTLSDIVTTYHPSGDPTPAYRYVVTIAKVQSILYNLDYIFTRPEWEGAPLIPDGQPTVNPNAKTPAAARAEIAALIDQLALYALISDPAAAKATIQAAISSSNPNRLDVAFTVAVSGNSGIISVDFNFGFYFGTASAA